MKNEDVPLLLLIVGGRRGLLSPTLHENTPHHVFGPQIDGIADMAVFVFVRISKKTKMLVAEQQLGNQNTIKIPAINNGILFDVIPEFTANQIY